MNEMQTASEWKSCPLFCLPPSRLEPALFSSHRSVKKKLLGDILQQTIVQDLFDLFFNFHDQIVFTLPICLMTDCSTSIFSPFLLDLAKRLLFPFFNSVQWKKNVILVDFKELSDSLGFIRELQPQCAIQGEGEPQVVFLCGVNYLSLNAQSALLKFLEEPPSNVQIILTTSHFSCLPSTFLSRCLKTHFLIKKNMWLKWLMLCNNQVFEKSYIEFCIRTCPHDPNILFSQLQKDGFEKYDCFYKQITKAYFEKNLFGLLSHFLNIEFSLLEKLSWYEDIILLWITEDYTKKEQEKVVSSFSFEVLHSCWQAIHQARLTLLEVPGINPELLCLKMLNKQMLALLKKNL